MNPIPYAPDVEQMLPDEAHIIEQLSEVSVQTQRKVLEKTGSAKHGTHAKATGFVKGQLTVAPDLPPELAQGLFARPGQYDTIVRFSQGPPEPVSDKAVGQRGMAVKVLGVQGPHLPQSRETTTQDWVLAPDPAFINVDAKTFLESFRLGASKSPYLPQEVVIEGSRVARAVEDKLEAVGLGNPSIRFFGRAPLHPFSHPYYSQVAVRYGDYIAKVGMFPNQKMLDIIGDRDIDTDRDDNAFRSALVAYCARNEAEFEFRVQLCTDLEAMPVEDATVQWPEDQSQYRTVARLVVPPQDAYNEARRLYFDQRLAWNPAHCLEAHRPLGSIMRARMKVYVDTQEFRQNSNQAAPAEPQSLADVPD